MSDIPETQADKEKQMALRPSRARYDQVCSQLERKWRRREQKNDRMMREVVDILWDAFGHNPYSWCGFYLVGPEGQGFLPGPCREKASESAAAVAPVCAQVVSSAQACVAAQAREFPGVCASSDLKMESFIAAPVFDRKGKVWAVFFVESGKSQAFDSMDQRWLDKILRSFSQVGAVQ